MDTRTIGVAKLLHSARKGRTDRTNTADGDGDGGDQSTSRGGVMGDYVDDDDVNSNQQGPVYAADNVNATPRTIEVSTTNDVNPVYKDALAKVSPKTRPKSLK